MIEFNKKDNVIAIIPARSYSQRLPHKNILPFCGKPLLAWTIQQAQSSQYISQVIVSTEDDEIGRIARQYGADVINRPSSLALAETPTLPVIQHSLNYLERYAHQTPLIIVLLQVTSPLRTTEDIDNAISLLLETGSNSVVSVCGGKENGAIWVNRRGVLLFQSRLIDENSVCYYEMPPKRSVDIDTQEDFALAERIMKGGIDDHYSRVLHKLGKPDDGKRNDSKGKGRRGRPRKVSTL